MPGDLIMCPACLCEVVWDGERCLTCGEIAQKEVEEDYEMP